MKNPILWCALVLGLMSVGVSAEPATIPPAPVAPQAIPCEAVTGSRLPRQRLPNGECDLSPASGRSYSREDLDRTGSIDLADALRRLDSGIR